MKEYRFFPAVLSALLCLALLTGACPSARAADSADAPRGTPYAAIRFMEEHYQSDSLLLRSALPSLLARAACALGADAPGGAGYVRAAAWAESVGLFSVAGQPAAAVTRQEYCLALFRLLACCGYTLPVYGGGAAVSDAPEEPYAQAVQALADGGVLVCGRDGGAGSREALTIGDATELLERLFLFASLPEEIAEMPESDVAESPAAEASWFDGACFAGNSLVNCFADFFDTDGADFYGVNGISARKGLTYTGYPLPGDRRCTLAQAFAQRDYHVVYIMYGTNDLSAAETQAWTFLTSMQGILELALNARPEAQIVLLSVPPVSRWAPRITELFRQSNIHTVNRFLKNLSRYYGVHYLDLYTPLADENGDLRSDTGCRDGIHIQKEGCDMVKEYLLRHTT